MMGYGRPLKTAPWEWRDTTSPAGSSGGSAEGASEGRQYTAAPNRPPSAARRAGGPSNRKGKPPCPQGAEAAAQRPSPALLSLERLPRIPSPRRPPRRRPKQQKRKVAVPAGRNNRISKGKPCFSSFSLFSSPFPYFQFWLNHLFIKEKTERLFTRNRANSLSKKQT